MNYIKITKNDIANGPGVRCVLWVAGCTQRCHGCQNPSTWDFNSGKLFDWDAQYELLEALNKSYVQGITFSGGHPLEDSNLVDIYSLIAAIRCCLPNKDIWLYTGLTWENIMANNDTFNDALRQRIISLCDVVIDGPYIEEQRDISLAFRGSKNQRLIDVKETLKQGKIITLQND